MKRSRKFWDRIAARYAARPLKDVGAYEAMLAATAARLSPRDRVLELGCGTGGAAIRLAPEVAAWIATDFSPEMIRISRAKPGAETVDFRVADAHSACAAGPFDVICAFNLLHLVDDLPGLLDQIHEALRPGGLLIAKTWCFAEVKPGIRALFRILRLFRLFPPVQMLRTTELEAALAKAGFQIIDQQVFGRYAQNPYMISRRADQG